MLILACAAMSPPRCGLTHVPATRRPFPRDGVAASSATMGEVTEASCSYAYSGVTPAVNTVWREIASAAASAVASPAGGSSDRDASGRDSGGAGRALRSTHDLLG